MKKVVFMLIVTVFIPAPTLVWAQGIQTQNRTSAEEQNKKDIDKEQITTINKITMERKEGVHAASVKLTSEQTGNNIIYVHDDAGNTINSFVVPEEIGLTEKTRQRVTTEYKLNRPKTFMALYVADVRMLPPDYHFNTGYYSLVSYTVTLLDAKGNVYFTKTIEGIPDYISENGKYVICFKEDPGILEDVSWKVKENPPLTKITVLDQKGNEVEEIEENLIARNMSRISDNGEWLLYRSGPNLDSYKIQNIKNHRKYDVGQIDYHISRILDNGTILIEKYNQRKDEYYEEIRPLGK